MFLLYAGLLTGALLMDDLFMVHERVYPKVLASSEETIFALYAVLFAFYLVLFRDDLLKSDPKIQLVSIVLLAFSILMDVLENTGIVEKITVFHRVAEDGSKFIGIWAWAVFHFRAAWLTRERLGIPTPGPPR